MEYFLNKAIRLLSVNTKNLYCSANDRPEIHEKGKIFTACLIKKDGKKIYVEISPRGYPSFCGSLYINVTDWGAHPIEQSDFDIAGIVLSQSFPSSSNGKIIYYNQDLWQQIQSAIDSGKEKFQIRIQFTGTLSDNDSNADGWRYEQESSSIVFNIAYYK